VRWLLAIRPDTFPQELIISFKRNDSSFMSALVKRSFIILLVLFAACTPASETALTKALQAAVKDKKVSAQKMERIIREYEVLRKEDKAKSAEYVDKVVSVIEMGGDSSHIDVIRKQFQGGKAKV
jgi:hypothetical protein